MLTEHAGMANAADVETFLWLCQGCNADEIFKDAQVFASCLGCGKAQQWTGLLLSADQSRIDSGL